MRRYLTIPILAFFLTLSAFAEDDKPVVIAISPFAGFRKDSISIRDKIVSNLVQNYDCIILSRSKGVSLATENAINKLKSLDSGKTNQQNILAADFAVTGFYVSSRGKIKSTLIITDLTDNRKMNFVKEVIFSPKNADIAQVLTDKIVQKLKLNPKEKKTEQKIEKREEVWAVLPCSYTIGTEKGNELSLLMELALQESGKLKHLVGHTHIDKVLKEIKMTSMSGKTESLAGDIGKLVGADKVVMGNISKNKGKDNCQIDLLLIDSNSSVVVNAATAVCPVDKLNSTSQKLVVNLLYYHSSMPGFKNATPKMRYKECDIYDNILFFLAWKIKDYKNGVDVAIALAESIYLLAYDKPKYIYDAQSRFFFTKLSENDKKRLVKLSDKMLANIKHSKETKNPHLRRFHAHLYINDFEGARKLIELSKKHNPNIKKYMLNGCIAKMYYQQKNYAEAAKYANMINDDDRWQLLRSEIYRATGDEKKELKFLKLFCRREDAGRCFKLISKLESPQRVIEFAKTRKVSSWAKVLPEVQIEVAKAHFSLGDKQKAAVIIDAINNDKAIKKSRLTDTKELKKDIAALAEKLIDYKVQWLKISDVVSIPDKYKIYIQPISKPDMAMINNAIPQLEEFFGVKVKVLPTIPIAEDPYTYKKARGQYDSKYVLDRVLRVMKMPDDALYVMNVTNQDMYWGTIDFVYASYLWNQRGYITSTYRWEGAGSDYVLTDMLVKTVCGSFKWLIAKSGEVTIKCVVPGCIMSADGTAWGARDKRFALCGDCQVKIKKIDFNKVFTAFQRKRNFRKIKDAEEKEWVDSYKKNIDKALAEAKKKVEEDANKQARYLPAVIMEKEPTQGLKYQYFEFEKDACKLAKDLSGFTAKETGITDIFNLEKAKRKEFYGLIFNGYIKIPHDGKYQFYLSSDDGSRLWIDDKEIIENDKMQAPFTKIGEIGLKAGYHKIKVSFIQGKGGAFLSLYWRGPKTLGQPIPADVLFYKKI